MDIQETRRRVLRELIKTRNNGVVRQFASEIGKPDGQINDMLATPPRKSFGERVARQIESLAKVATKTVSRFDYAASQVARQAGCKTNDNLEVITDKSARETLIFSCSNGEKLAVKCSSQSGCE